jgi:vancomycin resistance protein YoaR
MMNRHRSRTWGEFDFPAPLQRAFLFLLSATCVFLAGIAIFLLGSRIFFAGKAFPGVQTAGASLSGNSQEDIELILSQRLTYPTKGLIVFQAPQQLYKTKPSDLGVEIDTSSMAIEALNIGREGNLLHQFAEQLRVWVSGAVIDPILIFDQRQARDYLSQLAAEIDRPMIEASIRLNGLEVETSSGQIGQQLDIDATIDELLDPISRMFDSHIDLVIREIPPQIPDASEQAALAEEILSQEFLLTAGDDGSWSIKPKELAEMLRFEVFHGIQDAEYRIDLDPNSLVVILTPLAVELEHPAENARFIFNDDTKELDLLRVEVIGRELNLQGTIEAIHKALLSGKHEVALSFDYENPQVDQDATASDLGISEAVSAISTYFYDSGSARVHNISTAASAFHGLLLAPGETLSMANVLGDISLDTGYAEALIIYGDSTIEGVGGGVCQVSTTLFRAAFFGGYPIVERYSHAYRVGYYEQGPNSPGPGLDASVFVPIVDFKFTNDRSSWLLLETYIYGNQLLWKFYSAPDERQVEWTKKETNEVEAPDPLYKENPDLSKGKIRQIEWEADGLDVLIERTVILDDQILYQDSFITNYLPWRAVFEYGPGTKLPKDAKTE